MNASFNVAVKGFCNAEPDPSAIQAARAEYLRLREAHMAMSQKSRA